MKTGIATFVTDEGIHPARLGAAMEERGFDSLFLAEHSHIPASRETPYPGGGELPRIYYRTLDPFVALTAAAGTTRNLLLATGVALIVQRDPIHTANEAASLDQVSGGRAVLGVGAGWNREEMRQHGTDPATRGALMNERLAAIKELWAAERAEFHGRFVDLEPSYAWPKPVQRPHPPIYVGGESDGAVARLLEHGDGWLPRGHTSPALIRDVRERFAQQRGTPLPVSVFAAPPDKELVEGWLEAGVERVTLLLPTAPEDESLRKLDELAEFAENLPT